MSMKTPCLVLTCVLGFSWSVIATPPSLETSIHRGLSLVTKAAGNWPKHKTCFSCHHQTLPLLSVVESARTTGHPIDSAWIKTQSDITHAYFNERIDDMNAGDHVPGGATTVGYGFWAMRMTDQPADDTTTAMAAYLLQVQGKARLKGGDPADLGRVENGRWTTSCRRPPMQGSDVADTVLSLLGMEKYASASQRPAFAKSKAAAMKWLAQARLERQEDRIWRLWGIHELGGDEPAKQAVRNDIFKVQQADGGWSQAEDLPSDAFSTGQTLLMLCKTGTAVDHPAIQKARDYLLQTQLGDGSWLVKSRVKNKVQPYFENGDPHGEHQFLSTAATAWAVAGLAQLLPPPP